MIKLPDGHPENLDGDHGFLQWVKDASLQAPPNPARDEVGRKIEACFRLMATHVETYRAAVLAESGHENTEARVQVNVRNAARRAGLGAVLGL